MFIPLVRPLPLTIINSSKASSYLNSKAPCKTSPRARTLPLTNQPIIQFTIQLRLSIHARRQYHTHTGHIVYPDFTFPHPITSTRQITKHHLLGILQHDFERPRRHTASSTSYTDRAQLWSSTLAIYVLRLQAVRALLQVIVDVWKSSRARVYAVTHVGIAVIAYLVLSVWDGMG